MNGIWVEINLTKVENDFIYLNILSQNVHKYVKY